MKCMCFDELNILVIDIEACFFNILPILIFILYLVEELYDITKIRSE
jgi:hypothetical protein